jgi:hypothetical protein
MKYTDEEYNMREKLVSLIEGITGTIETLRYDLMSTNDLLQLSAGFEILIPRLKELGYIKIAVE